MYFLMVYGLLIILLHTVAGHLSILLKNTLKSSKFVLTSISKHK